MLNAMMTRFCTLAIAQLNPFPLSLLRCLKEGLHTLVELALIPFKRQYIVPTLVNDLGSNIPLGSHRIQGDNCTLNIQ